MRLPPFARILLCWLLTRTALLLCVFGVLTLRGPDVTTDVSVIYQGWAEILRSGSFPRDDVTWQYPPGAALPVLAPDLLPFLRYEAAFFVLACGADAVVLGLLLRRPVSRAGAWTWVAGVPLLGPTVYARYDLMVTAVAVGAVLAVARHPRTAGALIALGALVKVWPALLLAGVRPGRGGRRLVASSLVTAGLLAAVLTLAAPHGWDFLFAQRDRGLEVESVGALVFHLARYAGWEGYVSLHYGSMEFLGPHVATVATASLLCTVAALAWLVRWRLRVVTWQRSTAADAALAAVLLFTVTSRVISPQYLVWLVGLAAAALALGSARQRVPAGLILAATALTVLEFPLYFDAVVASEPLGVTLLVLRNGLLLTAAALSCLALWRSTVARPGALPATPGDAAAPEPVRAGSPR